MFTYIHRDQVVTVQVRGGDIFVRAQNPDGEEGILGAKLHVMHEWDTVRGGYLPTDNWAEIALALKLGATPPTRLPDGTESNPPDTVY